MTALLVLLACTDSADVQLDGRPLHDLEEDTAAAAFEGDDAGECGDGADNDRDGAFDCNDADCAAAPDCAPVDDTGDSGEDTAQDTGVDTAPQDTGLEDSGETGDTQETGIDTAEETGVDTGPADTGDSELECASTPTEIVGLEVSCSADVWTVDVQFDGPPAELDVILQDWDTTSTGGHTMGASGDHDSRASTLRLNGTCCETILDRDFTCADDIEVIVMLIDATGTTSLDWAYAGPAGGYGGTVWSGPAPTCP